MDDPQDRFNEVAKRLRAIVLDIPGEAITPHGKLLFLIADVFDDALDPPPEPEPIPPGELVIDNCGCLRRTTQEGLTYLEGGKAPDYAVRLATVGDVQRFTNECPNVVFYAVRDFARLLVSQEQPPDLIGGDEDVFTTPERRLGKAGEYCFDAVTGRVFYLHCDTVIPAWTVTKK